MVKLAGGLRLAQKSRLKRCRLGNGQVVIWHRAL